MRWSDDIKTGVVNFDEILDMKINLKKLESRVLPTVLDKWVSLHPSFGLICWADDDDLKRQFVHSNEVDFLQLGEVNIEEKEMLSEKTAMLMKKLGVPALSEVCGVFFAVFCNLFHFRHLNMLLASGCFS